MRPTSESDRDARTDDDPSPDSPRSDPWASGPGHLAHDDQAERFVPGQRDPAYDPEHDGHLYASDTYAEPETTVLPDGSRHDAQDKGATSTDPDATVAVSPDGHHDNAVGVAQVDTGHDAPSADRAAAKADEAKAEADEAKAEAERARDHDHADDRTDDPAPRHDHEVETVALPPAEPVAIVEPVDDRPGGFAAVPVAVPAAGVTDGSPAELKPGDVPVEPVTGFFSPDAAQDLRDRWREAQLGFVDDPRKAVDDVKALVSEAVDRFTAAVAAQRDTLEAAGDDTEQYRVAVQRYRSFFDRLLDL